MKVLKVISNDPLNFFEFCRKASLYFGFTSSSDTRFIDYRLGKIVYESLYLSNSKCTQETTLSLQVLILLHIWIHSFLHAPKIWNWVPYLLPRFMYCLSTLQYSMLLFTFLKYAWILLCSDPCILVVNNLYLHHIFTCFLYIGLGVSNMCIGFDILHQLN